MSSRKDWCYNPITDKCDGRCQGASECILAQYLRGERGIRPSRKQMVNIMRESDSEAEYWDNFMNSEDGKQFLKEVFNSMGFRKVFLSHPLGNNFKENRKLVDILIKRYHKEFNDTKYKPQNPIQLYSKQKIIFISPLHSFIYLDEENTEFGDVLMEICFDMIDMSEEVWLCGNSEGCREEAIYAFKKDKHIYIVEKDLTPKRYFCNPLDYLDNCDSEYTYDTSLLFKNDKKEDN